MDAPHRPATPLTLRLFGPFEARVNGALLPPMRTRKDVWLLAQLALHAGLPLDRAWLASLLWPDSAAAVARGNLRRSLTSLRRALGPEAERIRFPTPRSLLLERAGAEIDLLAFDEEITRGDPESLARAVALYRGPLLDGCTEGWALPLRQIREEAYLAALERLAEHAIRAGEPAAAQRALRRVVAADPTRESAQRALMETLAANGNFAAVLQVYRDLRLRLHQELAAAPDPHTTALFERLRTEAGAGSTVSHPSSAPRAARHASNHNLPHLLTRFIGREREVVALRRLLTEHRLVTLTGAGGCGKTRLAIEAARDLTEAFADGIWLVELASLADPDRVPQAVAAVLEIREEEGAPHSQAIPADPGALLPRRSLTATLSRALRSRELLLVLDNCEHLLDACACLAETLLHAAPAVRVLATSREALGIAGERTFRVPPLSVPPATAPMQESLLQYEGVQLFVDRASLRDPEFAVTGRQAAAVAEISRRLDGIPLAIELAAAQVRTFTLPDIAAHLEDRFRHFASPNRTALPRHRTLKALLDWSYDLLSEPEQTLLRRLSVFAGGWTLEAATAVCREESHRLPVLVEKSLVQQEEAGGAVRYRLLETVRTYARDQLVAVGAPDRDSEEETTARDRHLTFFAVWAEEAVTHLGTELSSLWAERMEREHDNMRAALQWARRQAAAKSGLRLAAALGWFCWWRGYMGEGKEQVTQMLATTEGAPGPERLGALRVAARLAFSHRDLAGARSLAEEVLATCRRLGDRRGEAEALGTLASVVKQQCEEATARRLYRESIAVARALGAPELARRALNDLGLLEAYLGNYPRARALLEEGLSLSRATEDRLQVSVCLNNLGIVALGEGKVEEAQAFFTKSIRLKWEMGHTVGVTWGLAGMAQVAAARAEPERAARLYSAAAAAQAASGIDLPAGFDARVAALRAEMGAEAFDTAWTAGQALSLEAAVAEALAREEPFTHQSR